MTPEEITKLAVELAKDWIEVNNLPAGFSSEILSGVAKDMKRAVCFILRTHCIVSKEKVRNRYNMAKSNIKPQYLEACQYEVGTTQVIESLFDPDTFDETDK